MSLPKWIEAHKECCGGCEHYSCGESCRLFEALSIAWEALESLHDHVACHVCKPTKEAMRRIEEIGKPEHGPGSDCKCAACGNW